MNGNGERILVVEDEEGVRKVITRLLASAGYDVVEAATGEEALERFAGDVKLVLTDVIMPGMGGAELGKRLARIRPGVKIVYTSGYPDEMLQAQGTVGSGARVIEKPVERQALLKVVREMLGGG